MNALAENTLIDTKTGRAIDLAMQKLEVTGRVYPLGSFVRVTHRFRCLGTKPMEAIYVSALPTGGVVRRFKVIGENFQADSKLEPRKKARAEYEQGVAGGHLSVLAETNQDGLVHLSVGQVQPDEEITVIMDVVVGVTTKDQGFQFRYPFTLAPNYHPQARVSATAGGGKIELPEDVFGDMTLPEWKTSGFGLHEVSFNLQVCAGTNLMSVSSPSHRISVAPQVDGTMMVSLAGMGDTPNRDLVLDMVVPEAHPMLFSDASLLGGETASEGSAVIPQGAPRWTALMPSTTFTKTTRQPRKVCFVLDRSGSMTGSRDHDSQAPILGAKRALLACLSALQPDDEFGLVHFGSDAVAFHPTLAKADDFNRKKAQAWVEKIQCQGGTEMLGALAAATRVLGGPGGDVFILTDGEVAQTGPIVEHMAASQSRVHVLGIGTAAQHRFMAQLARRTNGVCEMVAPSGAVDMAGLKLFNQVKEPVLANPKVTVDGMDIADTGTVWEGLPLMVTDPKGEGSLPGSLLVDGQIVPSTSFVQVKVLDGLTALLWAGRKLEDLSTKMDMVPVGTPKRDILETEMTTLSTAYSLASRVMSLVAVVERVGDQAGVTPEQKVVAVGLPEGMSQDFFGQGLSRGIPIATSASAYYSAPGSFTGTLGGGLLRSRSSSGAGRLTKSASVVSTVDSMELFRERSDVYVSATNAVGEHGARSLSFCDADYNKGGVDMDSISVSLTAPVACAGPAAAAGPQVIDPDAWSFTGNLLIDLASLKSDGGLPGYGIQDRVMQTILLALIVAVESQQFPGVYDQHIERMKAFIKANAVVLNDAISVHKAVAAIARPSECKLDRNTLVASFNKPLCDVLLSFRTIL